MKHFSFLYAFGFALLASYFSVLRTSLCTTLWALGVLICSRQQSTANEKQLKERRPDPFALRVPEAFVFAYRPS